MKHLPLGLVALWLASIPLSAAAVDYVPNQRWLAAAPAYPQGGGEQPPLPGAALRSDGASGMLRPMTSDAGSDASPGPGVGPAVSGPVAPPRGGASTTATAARPPARPSPSPRPAHSQPSWQSLLPGSIQ